MTNQAAKKLAAPALAIFVSIMSLGCSNAQPMTASTSVPAGEGTVETAMGDDGNTELVVRVRHLGQPSNVEADATVYVVWIQARDGANQNVGTLTVSDDLEGTFKTITPHRRFTLHVTPEPNGRVALPTHDPVFTANVDSQQ